MKVYVRNSYIECTYEVPMEDFNYLSTSDSILLGFKGNKLNCHLYFKLSLCLVEICDLQTERCYS